MERWATGQQAEGLPRCEREKEAEKDNEEKTNNSQDALIAEVAIVQKLTLVTADNDLAEAAREHGRRCDTSDNPRSEICELRPAVE